MCYLIRITTGEPYIYMSDFSDNEFAILIHATDSDCVTLVSQDLDTQFRQPNPLDIALHDLDRLIWL